MPGEENDILKLIEKFYSIVSSHPSLALGTIIKSLVPKVLIKRYNVSICNSIDEVLVYHFVIAIMREISDQLS